MSVKRDRKILITRPEIDAKETAQILRAKGYDVLCEPMIGITYQKKRLTLSTDDYAGLIFTSRNGVRAFLENCDNRDLSVFTVGDKTLQDVQDSGFKNVQSASGTVDDLKILLSQNSSDKPYLYVRGAEISQPLKGSVNGVQVEEKILYHADIKEEFSNSLMRNLIGAEISDVLFYSKRTAEAFIDIVQKHEDKNLLHTGLKASKALCLGRSMLEYVSVLPWQDIRCADHPDQDHLIALLDK